MSLWQPKRSSTVDWLTLVNLFQHRPLEHQPCNDDLLLGHSSENLRLCLHSMARSLIGIVSDSGLGGPGFESVRLAG